MKTLFITVIAAAKHALASTIIAMGQAPPPDDGWQSLDCDQVNGVPVVRVTINDAAPEWFFFEPTLASSTIDEDYADHLRLPASREPAKENLAGRGDARVDAEITLAGRHLASRSFLTSSVSRRWSPTARIVPRGTLRAELFAGCAVRIDLRGNSIKIRPSLGYLASGAIVPCLSGETGLIVPLTAEIGGQRVGIFAEMALGIAAPCRIHTQWFDQAVGARLAVRAAPAWDRALRNVRIGGLQLDEVPIAKSASREAAGRFNNGFVGRSFLERFIVTVDADRQRIVLEPGEDWQRPFEPLTATRPAPPQSTTPWQLVESRFVGDRVFVRAVVEGGTATWMLLDSGSPHCVIDSSMARDLGIEILPAAPDPVVDPTSLFPLSSTPPRPIRIGTCRFQPRSLKIAPLSDRLQAAAGCEILGLLGIEFFLENAVRVNFKTREVRVCPSSAVGNDITGEVVPFGFSAGGPAILALLNSATGESLGIPLVVDTGFTGTFALPLSDALRVDPNVGKLQRGMAGMTLYGPASGATFRVDSFTVGSRVLKSVRAVAFEQAPPFDRWGALLGTDILRRFEVTFDLSLMRVVLEPNEDFDRPFLRRWCGLLVESCAAEGATPEADRELRVTRVERGSPAAQSNLRAGDAVLSINGVSMKSVPVPEFLHHIAHSFGDIALRIRRDGEVLDVTIVPSEAEGSMP